MITSESIDLVTKLIFDMYKQPVKSFLGKSTKIWIANFPEKISTEKNEASKMS